MFSFFKSKDPHERLHEILGDYELPKFRKTVFEVLRRLREPASTSKDIAEVMQGKEFKKLSDSQKDQLIAELHKRWNDPNSEIAKRMNSFAEKSPEILKPILES